MLTKPPVAPRFRSPVLALITYSLDQLPVLSDFICTSPIVTSVSPSSTVELAPRLISVVPIVTFELTSSALATPPSLIVTSPPTLTAKLSLLKLATPRAVVEAFSTDIVIFLSLAPIPALANVFITVPSPTISKLPLSRSRVVSVPTLSLYFKLVAAACQLAELPLIVNT
jgi:hypothetical protein